MDQLYLLALLLAANGTPLLARRALGDRLRTPLDGGLVLFDGYRLLGPSKTVVGLLVGCLVTALLGELLGIGWQVGLLMGLLALLGDAVSSFVKRRLGMPAGTMALGLDQVPESLLPLLVCKSALALNWGQVTLLVIAFMLVNLAASRLLYHLGIRDHPY